MGGLIDSTLREGAQAPVAYLTAEQQRAVLTDVLAIGVEEVELGPVVVEPGYRGRHALAELLDQAAGVRPAVRRAVWCRARPDDVAAAAGLRPEVVSFALPVSDRHLSARLRTTRADALRRVGELVAVAREAGVGYVSVGLEDATRADPGFLDDVVAAADGAGADRVRVADTVGVAEPGELVRLVGRVVRGFRGEVGVHVHDDFGMATAGAVAALAAGAHWADVSLTGLGERAGIARTEEVVAWLAVRRGAGYDVRAACEAARRLAELVGRPVPPDAPVIGSELFTCESGLHLAGLAVDPATYEPFPPQTVGAERVWRLGRGCGRAAVAALVPGVREPVRVAAAVRRLAEQRGRSLDPAELGRWTAANEAGGRP